VCFNAHYIKWRHNNSLTNHNSPVSVVSWLLAGRERNRGSIPGRGNEFLSPSRQALEPTQPHRQQVPGARYPRVKLPWCKSWPLNSSADGKNEWNHTSTPPPALMAWAGTALLCYSDIMICELNGSVCNIFPLFLVHSSQKYGCGAGACMPLNWKSVGSLTSVVLACTYWGHPLLPLLLVTA
jgi:hypothetical protein